MQKAGVLNASKNKYNADDYIGAIKTIASSKLGSASKIKKMAEISFRPDTLAGPGYDHAHFLAYVIGMSKIKLNIPGSRVRSAATVAFFQDNMRRLGRSIDDYSKGNVYKHEYRFEAHYFGYDECGQIVAIYYNHKYPKYQIGDARWDADQFVDDATEWGRKQPEYIKLPGVKNGTMRLHAVVTASRVVDRHNEAIHEEFSKPLPCKSATKNI